MTASVRSPQLLPRKGHGSRSLKTGFPVAQLLRAISVLGDPNTGSLVPKAVCCSCLACCHRRATCD